MLTRAELTKWTSALRANPEQQITGGLANDDYTGFCCLGKLCEVFEIPRAVDSSEGSTGYAGSTRYNDTVAITILPADLAKKFGDAEGDFINLNMPILQEYKSAVIANDRGVSWLEIADHFDKYYPCSDEQPKKEGE